MNSDEGRNMLDSTLGGRLKKENKHCVEMESFLLYYLNTLLWRRGNDMIGKIKQLL